jgi:hypothetical protein
MTKQFKHLRIPSKRELLHATGAAFLLLGATACGETDKAEPKIVEQPAAASTGNSNEQVLGVHTNEVPQETATPALETTATPENMEALDPEALAEFITKQMTLPDRFTAEELGRRLVDDANAILKSSRAGKFNPAENSPDWKTVEPAIYAEDPAYPGQGNNSPGQYGALIAAAAKMPAATEQWHFVSATYPSELQDRGDIAMVEVIVRWGNDDSDIGNQRKWVVDVQREQLKDSRGIVILGKGSNVRGISAFRQLPVNQAGN